MQRNVAELIRLQSLTPYIHTLAPYALHFTERCPEPAQGWEHRTLATRGYSTLFS